MPELHSLLAARWSPRAFDPVTELTRAELSSLVEAARWAPSAANSQPWRFAVGRRDEETHKRIFANLTPADQRWAGAAAALIVAAHVNRGPAGEPLPHAAYDLGQAVAHLWIQATALGMHARQLRGFDGAGLRADLDLPDEVTLATVIAVGRLGDPDDLPADLRAREMGLRSRRPADKLLIAIG